MTATATIKIMSPEEIAARPDTEIPFVLLPQRETVFAERAMRMRQLAHGSAMKDYLLFLSDLANAQQQVLNHHASVDLPTAKALEHAALGGEPVLDARSWPRHHAWQTGLKQLLSHIKPKATAQIAAVISELEKRDSAFLEQQADCLIHHMTRGLDMAAAPFVAAALQVYWTHLVTASQSTYAKGTQPVFSKIDDTTRCPCCGSQPTASLIKPSADSIGQRYLHCSLCSTQWHMMRIKCTHCGDDKKISYQSLTVADASSEAANAAQSIHQAEVCDHCDHYLKIFHAEKDAFVEPIADDLSTLSLDLLVSETGKQRHGVNYFLLFGQEDGYDESDMEKIPPDPGAH